MNKLDEFGNIVIGVTLGFLKMLFAIFTTPKLFAPTFLGLWYTGYFVSYTNFLQALGVCILADSVFGVWIAIKNKTFEMSKSFSIIQKIVVYSFYLIIVHYITRLDWIIGFDVTVVYLTRFILTAMILEEARSATRNGNILFPNAIAGRIVWFFDKIEGRMNDKVNKDNKNE